MGLLDDLKQQADSLRQKQQVTQEELNQNLLRAHAKLKDALHYWVELFNSLNVIKPVIPRHYYFEGGVSQLENLMQHDYNVNGRRLTIDHKDYIDGIILRFRCASHEKLIIEKQSDPMVQRMREHLWANNLKFEVKEVKNDRGYVERGIFTIAPEVPVSITISADLESAQVNILAKNLEKFGEYTYTYDYDEFGMDLLEELAKVIIAKPNAFRSMGKHQAALRSTTSARLSRVEPLYPEAPAQPAAAADMSDPTRSFFGNIKSMLKR